MLPSSIQNLAQQLRNFPGVGVRSSQKLALDVLELPEDKYETFIDALRAVRQEVTFCRNCGFFAQGKSSEALCEICNDKSRIISQICLVEKPTDILSVEKSQIYRGSYHVLKHLISPLDNIFPEDTTVQDLVERRLSELTTHGQKVELILFLKAGFAAEATTAYIREILKQKKLDQSVQLTRLAQGLPLYFNPDTLDQGTMAKAVEDRREI